MGERSRAVIRRAIGAVGLMLLAPQPVAAQSQDVYILAGQSNMAGYRAVREPARSGDERIQIYGPAGWRPVVREPGAADAIDGPGMAFARAHLTGHGDARIGLIPCAVSGSAISFWQPGAEGYARCLAKVRAGGARIAGILFYQGESDAQPGLSSTWAQRFRTMVAAWRRDLANPLLPIVFAQIGRAPRPGDAHWESVKAQQASLRLDRAAMIRTDDLPLRDMFHLSPTAHTTVGRRFSAAMRRFETVRVAVPTTGVRRFGFHSVGDRRWSNATQSLPKP
jgi:hypothetical protein